MPNNIDENRGSESTVRAAWAGLWLGGALAIGVLSYVELPLVGVGLYALAALTAITVWNRYPTTVFDERDANIHRRASGKTISLLGVVSATVFPALVALWGTGLYEWSPWTTASAFLVSAIFIVYFATTLSLSH